MPAQKIDGVLIAKHIRQHVAAQVEAITSSGRRAPGLAVVLVGSDAASHVYVNKKIVRKVVYICTESKLMKTGGVAPIVSSRICSKVKL